jgi:hypothetical protein
LKLSHITDDSDILESIAGHGFEMARNMFSREVFADGLVKALGIDIVV